MVDQILSIPHAATKLGVSRWHVRQLIKQGRLRGIALGAKAMRVRYISLASLDAFMHDPTKEVCHAEA